MRKEEFYFDSNDKLTKLKAVKYLPEEKPTAVLLVVHGMCEHIGRYDKFARFIADNGISFYGYDLLGHGDSITSEDKLGYFAEEGYKIVQSDTLDLLKIVKEENPDVPCFIMGHSMGSFITRYFLSEHGDMLDGAIIMGTGNQPLIALKLGVLITKIIATFKGWKYRSSFVNSLVLGAYNKKFEPSDTHCEWLSRNHDSNEEYFKDPKCGHCFTLNGFLNLFETIIKTQDKNQLIKMPKDLPIFFVSGDEDPVGSNGKEVKDAYNIFKELGMKDVKMKLYPNERHEILAELDADTVFNDILNWIKERV